MEFRAERYAGSVTPLDGGWSTILRTRNLPPDVVSEVANLTHRGMVLELSRAYIANGAEVLTTNTFAANALMFARRGIGEDAVEVARGGAEIARQAVGALAIPVVGVIGPSGGIMAIKEVEEGAWVEAVEGAARALAEGGVDAILLETFSELAELLPAVQAVREACDKPVIASMSFDSGPKRTQTMMGEEAEEVAAALDDAGVDVVGCNCGSGAGAMVAAVAALRGSTEKPIWVKPNAGLPDLVDGRPVYTQTAEEFVEPLGALVEAGANLIGGCCGVGPAHIRRLATMLRRRRGIRT